MTPLQQAAKSLLEIFYTTGKPIDVYVYDLRKALEAEQAQAVEPVPTAARRNRTAQEFMFGMDVLNWNRAQQDPPIDVGREMWVSDEALRLLAINDHPAPPAGKHVPESRFGNTERAELIARLIRKADAWDYLQPGATRLNACRQAADMLEADAQDFETYSRLIKSTTARERHTRETLRKVLAGTEAQQVAVPTWTLTAARMPKPCTNVLAHYGKKQPIRAMWVPAKTLEAGGDGDWGEYDEATDEIWWPEGWYETNAFEEKHWIVDGPVTHWMPLPAVPQGAKLVTKPDSKTDWSAA